MAYLQHPGSTEREDVSMALSFKQDYHTILDARFGDSFSDQAQVTGGVPLLCISCSPAESMIQYQVTLVHQQRVVDRYL